MVFGYDAEHQEIRQFNIYVIIQLIDRYNIHSNNSNVTNWIGYIIDRGYEYD